MPSPETLARSGAALLVAAGAMAVLGVQVVLAASPEPSSAAAGDPRSSGQGPGLVGDPVTAIAVVAVIAVATLLATLLYVRATGGSQGTDPHA